MQYIDFIKRKQIADVPTGFDADIPVGPLFDFQAACVKWALKRGRAALFLDTGLGKTLSQVTWRNLYANTPEAMSLLLRLCAYLSRR
jgi:hypothetical protein